LDPAEWIQIGSDHGDQIDRGVLEFWDTTGLDGLYSLRLSVVDHAMALREATIQVTVDNISPTLDLTYPENGAVYELGYDEWVNVNAEVNDYSVARVEFYADDQPEPFAVRDVAPFNVNWTIEALGTHTFRVVAVDEAGNVSESDPTTIQVVPRQEAQEEP
jgi:hypothetical protein